ncbi:LOW QUALITY PROTEIN: hypothetical protein Premu_2099 [Hallella multisaccharivorax DSM 17128]|uniref:WYL domain-containing protein n=1 Tax=Hallella multisaccharivorax DSM 17128 TaxID=688246 RepID=F8N7N1_9BACT|nr:LOW QUALITY PROTEIN: hypothetical protein Premu_2099 [Hallella multisaccharivorax DSM 17128]
MKIPELFKEYIWLVNTIYRARKISLAELNERWLDTEMSGGVDMARTTFNRHKDAIEDIFGIYIECDRKDGYRYYIGNPEVLEDDTVQNWMLSTMSLSNIISESMSLQERIIAEWISVDEDILEQLTKAMKAGRRITITYRNSGSPQRYNTGLDPYCLKLFYQKWYVLGRLYDNKYEVYCLNNIEYIEIQQHTFKIVKDFDPRSFFDDYYGVVIDDELPTERIVLRAYRDERFELRDVPLHHSQHFLQWNNDEDFADLEVRLKPTHDFIDFLMSKCDCLKVLSPQSLIDQLRDRMERGLNTYKINE